MRFDESVCFSIVAKGKTLDFAMPPLGLDDGKNHQAGIPTPYHLLGTLHPI